ncbi:MAG TPA: carboxypeptidase regulatory-like domain-containing protein [Candidatus Bathyarchaeota archaeon]|nr:carboxypeptidase regulatory-like domain-containing protein [Candidatus Bathyarchaeota archaeon]
MGELKEGLASLLAVLLVLAFAHEALAPTAAWASPTPKLLSEELGPRTCPSPIGNVTTYYGDLVASGSETLVIRDVDFTLYGSLIAMDQATVVIENAILTLCEVGGEMGNITIRDEAYIEVTNSTIRGEGIFYLYLLNETRAVFQGAVFEHSHEFYGAAEVTVLNSKVVWVDCFGSVRVSINNTIVEFLLAATDDARVWIRNSRVGTAYPGILRAQRNAVIEAYDCAVSSRADCYDNSTLWLLNVSSPSVEVIPPGPGEVGRAAIYVGWHLNVSVLLGDEAVSGAEVRAYFPNGSLAYEGATGPGGYVDMLLLEKVLHVVDRTAVEDVVRDYTIRAYYGDLEGEASVSLDGNKELYVSLLSTLLVTCLDGDGEAAGGVEVRLEPLGARRYTGVDGRALFTLLEPGSYELTAYYMGLKVAGPEVVDITDIMAYNVELSCAIYDLIVIVLNTKGEPISGATVRLLFANGTSLYNSLTDASGRVEFKNIPATTYKLVVEASGYKEAYQVVKLESEGQEVEFRLEAEQVMPGYLPYVAGGAIAIVVVVAIVVLLMRRKGK